MPDPGRRPGPGRHRPREPGARRLRRGRRPPPVDARLEHGRGARERAPLRRDEAPPGRDRPACRGARAHQRDRLAPSPSSSTSPPSRSSSASASGAIFDARSIFIAIYDEASNQISWPYDIDEGERFHREPRELGPGITSTVIRSGRPLRLGSIEEQTAAGAIQIGGSDTQSWLGVPIPAGDRVIGVVGLENLAPACLHRG